MAHTRFALEPLWAQTGWTPETILGQHPCKFLRLKDVLSWEMAAMDEELWCSMFLFFIFILETVS